MLARAILVGIVSGALTSWIAWSSWIPDSLAFHSICLAMICAIYLGFAISDGRLPIVILEVTIATLFLVLAFLGLWVAPAFVAAGLILHGIWDLAHRPNGITTRLPVWYPPFCAAYDFVFAGIFLYLARDVAVRT